MQLFGKQNHKKWKSAGVAWRLFMQEVAQFLTIVDDE